MRNSSMSISELMTEADKNMLEEYFTRGVNTQTCAKGYSGRVDLYQLMPFIQEGLPLYLKLIELRAEPDQNLSIVCRYKGEEVNIVMSLTPAS